MGQGWGNFAETALVDTLCGKRRRPTLKLFAMSGSFDVASRFSIVLPVIYAWRGEISDTDHSSE